MAEIGLLTTPTVLVQFLGERLISLSRFLEKELGVSWAQVPARDQSVDQGLLAQGGCVT